MNETHYTIEITKAIQFIVADFIYGDWLPQSQFERGAGVDLEIFDHSTYQLNQENSQMLYRIPLAK